MPRLQAVVCSEEILGTVWSKVIQTEQPSKSERGCKQIQDNLACLIGRFFEVLHLQRFAKQALLVGYAPTRLANVLRFADMLDVLCWIVLE